MIMSAVPAQRRKTLRRNLAAMNADGFSFSVMVGIGETYLPAFVLARGMGELTAALIATVPILLGSLLQLAAPLILQRVGSYRRFVAGTACVQAFSLLLLVIMAFWPDLPAWAVFVPATLYWAAGLSVGPAWNTWAEQIVPRRIRSGFFAIRSRLCNVGVLLGLVSGGLLLRYSAAEGWPVTIFGLLFAIGSAGRFLSAAMLSRQTESSGGGAPAFAESQNILARDRIGEMFRTLMNPGPIGRFVLFLMAVQTAVHVSGPYFTPFMLRTLNMSWGEYMTLLSLGFIGKMVSLPWAGRLANRAGADRLLWIGALGIMPVSALWLVSQQMWFLCLIQLLSGLMWGCYELAMLLQFFRQIPSQRRVEILTLYNLGNSVAMVAGSLIGAAILRLLGSGRDAYLMVFLASAFFRCSALFLLPGGRFVVVSTRSALRGWITRTIVVRPGDGANERPVYSTMSDSADDISQISAPTATALQPHKPRVRTSELAASGRR